MQSPNRRANVNVIIFLFMPLYHHEPDDPDELPDEPEPDEPEELGQQLHE